MEPFPLRTERLVLDQPTTSDVGDIALHCAEPVFEKFMTTPWPYERQHAEYFVSEFAPRGWANSTEWTWAIRGGGGKMMGAIGVRLNTGMIGYWLGAPHRGQGVMAEAVTAVINAVFQRSDRREVRWECVVGNVASLRVAQGVGFRFTGEGPGIIPGRNGALSTSWTGMLGQGDDGVPQPGWPI